MKNLLIASTARQRLHDQLAPFKGEVNIYEMNTDGDVFLEGNPIAKDKMEIHLGWLSSDLIGGETARAYAIALLKSQHLEWMQSVAAGFDAPIFGKLAEKGVRLTNSDAQAPAIAEYVLASVLNRYQRFDVRAQHQADKHWQDNHFRELYHSNWLIVGLGNIGKRVGKRAQGFEANVMGVKRQAMPSHEGADTVINYDHIPGVLAEQDVVVLSCALTAETSGIVNQEFLAQMKPGSILVNIGRGDLVDESALLYALDKGHLDYAILDVFQTEPLPEKSPFWAHPKVMLTPHSSNRGTGTNARGDALFIENLGCYLNNEPLKNEVDIKQLLPPSG